MNSVKLKNIFNKKLKEKVECEANNILQIVIRHTVLVASNSMDRLSILSFQSPPLVMVKDLTKYIPMDS
ncbi:uncharacterized protein OCT59_025154 [Rhizophagus irregularis]|uniref:uncharacterized protein n=1 Tax=Rhizophagus irregularis TaxID=588596 RepID=UPI0033243490|nr:hypothetical protein OCT59_025154 [Rhizophagus irregularis]